MPQRPYTRASYMCGKSCNIYACVVRVWRAAAALAVVLAVGDGALVAHLPAGPLATWITENSEDARAQIQAAQSTSGEAQTLPSMQSGDGLQQREEPGDVELSSEHAAKSKHEVDMRLQWKREQFEAQAGTIAAEHH